jgi:hypothetical protein
MADVNEKILGLANSFKGFNLPNGTIENGDSQQKAYFTAASTLYCLNTQKLDSIVDDFLAEYQLAREFGINDGAESDDTLLSNFTGRLQAAIDEENDLIAAEFAASQAAFSQSDSDLESKLTRSCAAHISQ